jgi:hypothetical protein
MGEFLVCTELAPDHFHQQRCGTARRGWINSCVEPCLDCAPFRERSDKMRKPSLGIGRVAIGGKIF